MSYAHIAKQNAPPIDKQPQPDPALWDTAQPRANNIADDTAKVNVVPHDFKSNPATVTSEADIIADSSDSEPSATRRDKKRIHKAEKEAASLWSSAKKYLLQPGVAGGLVGIINIGLLSTLTRSLYTQPHLRNNTRFLSSTLAGAIALLSVESLAAEQYAKTPRGKAEAKRAKKEGALVYNHLREQLLRPGVLGGIVGLLNTAVLGTVGYFSYTNWHTPRWDRRIVSAVSVGLFTLWSGEGLLAERYRSK